MNGKRVLIMYDDANITRGFYRLGVRVKWDILEQFLIKDNILVESVVFVGMPPQRELFENQFANKERFCKYMVKSGRTVITRYGTPVQLSTRLTYKANVDLLLTVECLDRYIRYRPDVVILATGDSDYVPLVKWLQKQGVYVVIASTADTVSSELLSAASEYLPLDGLASEFEAFVMHPYSDNNVMTAETSNISN